MTYDYITSRAWERKKRQIEKSFRFSKYCWVCDCTRFLDLHHERYENIYYEEFNRDVFWLCDDRCRCGNRCHRKVGFVQGSPIYNADRLNKRRKMMRRQYVLENFRPSTSLWFLYRFFYRLLW